MDRRWERIRAGRDDVLERLRDARFSGGIVCPRCRGDRVQRWGSFSGRQRYRCLGCRRTFSDLTGTPAAYLKKPELLPTHARCLEQALTIREAAARMGVHSSTAFRWRHRFLAALRETGKQTLSGWIEVHHDWYPHSRKGERGLDRPPRKRGPAYYYVYYRGPRAFVIAACDRAGRVATEVVTRPATSRIGPDDVARLLDGRVVARPTLVSRQGCYGPCGRLAHRKGWDFEQVGKGPRPWPAHIETVRFYILRFRRWLPRFRGVATRYLPNYLSWHQRLDEGHRRGLRAALLMWPVGAGFG